MPSAKYNELYQKVRGIKSGPSNDEMLQLYAYAKIAEGKDISEAPKPGMMDFAGKAKYRKWQETVDAGVSQQEADDKYVALAEELVAKHGGA